MAVASRANLESHTGTLATWPEKWATLPTPMANSIRTEDYLDPRLATTTMGRAAIGHAPPENSSSRFVARMRSGVPPPHTPLRLILTDTQIRPRNSTHPPYASFFEAKT